MDISLINEKSEVEKVDIIWKWFMYITLIMCVGAVVYCEVLYFI